MTKDGKYILAVDLGTSGPKSALVSTRGEVVDWQFEPNRLLLLPNGGAEQDPDEWFETILLTIERVLAKGLVPPEQIAAISCTGQWSGTVAVNSQGEHLMNAIIWMDTRGRDYVRKITGGSAGVTVAGYGPLKLFKWLRRAGGLPTPSGKDSAAHILYIKHELPDIYRRTHLFLEPKDYLNLRFTGRFAASYDSIALHWVTDNRDISRIRYDPELIRLSTIDRDKLPELKKSTDILGPIRKELAERLGLPRDVRVIVGTPDVQSAAIGSGAVRDFQAHLYLGTSSWLTCHVPFKKTDVFHNMATLPSAIPDRYFVGNEQETAGACLRFLADNLLFCEDELPTGKAPADINKLFDAMVEQVPAGSDKLIFTPWLYGERTPIEDHAIRSAFFNQSLQTQRGHFIRAVFEGVAYNTRWLLTHVERFVNRQFDHINVIGGGANSGIWCQIFADVLNRQMKRVKDPVSANVRGAALVASVGLGHLSFDQIPEMVEIAATHAPNPQNRDLYDALYREFRNIYERNKDIHRRLNRL